jgi:hypothetical protein
MSTILPASLALLLAALPASAQAGHEDRFAPGSEAGWTREPGSSAAALAWPAAGGPPGLAFDAALGFGSVWRPVDLGRGGCELSCEVEMTRGFSEPWRWPGVAVALASAELAAMGKEDWALVISLHKQGVRLTALRHGVYQPSVRADGAALFRDGEIPKRYEVTMGGAGGLDWSVEWPEKRLAGQRLRLWAARLADGRLRFAASHVSGPGAPWWEADAALPADLAARPLRVLAVRTVRAPGTPAQWTEPMDPKKGGSEVPAGLLRRVSARPLADGAKPEPPVFAETDLPPAWTLTPAAGEVHPSLYGDGAALAKARDRLKDPRWQPWRALVLQSAGMEGREAIQAEKGDAFHLPHKIGGALSSCAWAWILTGEPKARDRALELVDRLTTPTDVLPRKEHGWPGRRRQLLELTEFSCHAVEGLATAYDLMHADLGEARRRAALRVLNRALDYYRERMKSNDWWYADNPSNTIGVAGGCHGLGALALLKQRPKDVEEVLALAARAIRERYIGIAEDGGCLEGTLYWQYGGMYPAAFGLALERATGDGRGLLELPRFRNAGAYARVILGGDGEMTCFNDTQPWLSGLLPLAAGAGRHGDPLCLWLVDRMASLAAAGAMDRNVAGEKLNPSRPLVGDARLAGPALLLRLLRGDAAFPASFPGVPTLASLDSIAQGVLRSDGGEVPRLLVALKGNGARNTHHANADQGSLTLAARGETLLIDPGYFEPGADAHSLPVPAGLAPKALNEQWKATAPAPLSGAWEAGDLRTMTVDASAVAKPLGLSRQRRVLVLAGDRAAVVLDDLVPARGRLRMQAQLQCGFPAEVGADRRSARVKGVLGDLRITLDAPGLQLADAPRRAFSKDWIYSRKDRAWHPLRGEWDGEAEVPCVTVLQPVASGAEGEPVRVERAREAVTVHVGRTALRFTLAPGEGWKLARP